MDDETREFLTHLFEAADSVPEDVVPPTQLTRDERREHLLLMNRIADTYAEITIPGEVILDIDGLPVGVEAARTETVMRGGAVISTRDLELAGLTAEDVPNLCVVAPFRGETS